MAHGRGGAPATTSTGARVLVTVSVDDTPWLEQVIERAITVGERGTRGDNTELGIVYLLLAGLGAYGPEQQTMARAAVTS